MPFAELQVSGAIAMTITASTNSISNIHWDLGPGSSIMLCHTLGVSQLLSAWEVSCCRIHSMQSEE